MVVCELMTSPAFPDTSRKPKKAERESRMFAFTGRSKMETDIKNGRYLEHGEYEGNLYGIKTDSIQEVIEAGRICILDPNPQVRTVFTQLVTAHCHKRYLIYFLTMKSTLQKY